MPNATQMLNCSVANTSPKFSHSVIVGSHRGRLPTARVISVVVDDPYIAAAYSGKTETTMTTARNAYVTQPGRRDDGFSETGRPRAARRRAYRAALGPAVFSMNAVLIGGLLRARFL